MILRLLFWPQCWLFGLDDLLLGLVAGSLLAGGISATQRRPSVTMAAPVTRPADIKIMPTPDDEAIRESRRRAMAEQRRRRGRASTVLTEIDEALGG